MNIFVDTDFTRIQQKKLCVSSDVTLFSDSFDTFHYRLFSTSSFLCYSCCFCHSFSVLIWLIFFSVFWRISFYSHFSFVLLLFSTCSCSFVNSFYNLFFFRVNHTNTLARATLYTHNAEIVCHQLEIGQQNKRLMWRF